MPCCQSVKELHLDVALIFANVQILESDGLEIATRLEETAYAGWVEKEANPLLAAATLLVVDDLFFSDRLL